MATETGVWITRPTLSAELSRRLVDVAVFANRPGLALIAGGLPVLFDGRVAGVIGVAGAMTGAEDRRIAAAAVGAMTG